MAQPGDKCPKGCGGQLIVATSRQSGDMQLRYMVCNHCGCSGGKALVPISRVFKRSTASMIR